MAIIVFFTCSASKRAQYILPAMVPLAILVAIGVAAEAERAATVLRAAGRWAVVAGIGALAAALAGLTAHGGDFRAITPATLTATGGFLFSWGLLTAIGGRRAPVALACAAVFAPGLGLALLGPLTPYAEGRSSRLLAAQIGDGDQVVCVEEFRLGLPFYLQRPLVLYSRTGGELTSNYIESRAAHLMGRDGLIPLARFHDAVDDKPLFVLANAWRLNRVRELSPRRLVTVYADRRSVLLRPEG